MWALGRVVRAAVQWDIYRQIAAQSRVHSGHVPLPPVVVEIVAHDVQPELSAALLAACSRAVEGAECVDAQEAGSGVRPSAVAIVSWVGDAEVQIQVGLSREKEWRSRRLDFREEDAVIERWTAAGFAAGTLAGEIKAQAEPHPAPPPERPPPSPPPTPPALPPASPPAEVVPPPPSVGARASTWFDLEALVGRGLSTGPPRLGGALRAAFAPWGSAPYGAAVFGYARAPDDEAGVGARWIRVGLAAGYAWRPLDCTLCVQAYAELAGEQVRVWAVEAGTGRIDARVRWSAGALGGASVAWMPIPILGLVAGVELGWLEPGRVVRLYGQDHTELPRLQAAGTLGVRWRP